MRIISYNFKHYLHGDWHKRLRHMIDCFLKYDADVLALQSVRGMMNDGKNNMAREIQDELKNRGHDYPWVIAQPTMRHVDEKDTWEGLAIISRVSFMDSRAHVLPLGEGGDKTIRSVLYGRYLLGRTMFYVFNNNFSSDAGQAMSNAEQSHAFTEGRPEDALFLGDLNSTPDSKVIRYLKEKGWVDVWCEMHPEDSGFDFPAVSPSARKSYVFRSPNFNCKINGVKIVFDEINTDTGVYPSDHYGLMVDLEPE